MIADDSPSRVVQIVVQIFEAEYRELRPRAPMPAIKVDFYRFANVNNTIRLRQGRILVRLSDLLGGAPVPVLRSIAHILLAKLYRKPIHPAHSTRYRRHILSDSVSSKSHLIRKIRGRKTLLPAQGKIYDLDAIFETLNARFFYQLMARPRMSWSPTRSRHLLGHYDPAHNAIVVSKILDQSTVPRFVVEYLVYHEMLHLKHPVKVRGSRRCVHSKEFAAEEKLFAQFEQAKSHLRTL